MRTLYITHYGILEPLGQSQILPYLAGLSRRGHLIDILSFEKPNFLSDRPRVHEQARLLESLRIRWFPRPYRPGNSIRSLFADVLTTSREVRLRCRHDQIDLLHCRGHVPGWMALWASRLLDIPILFDLRGFLAEEYVDAGLWKPGGIKYRAVKSLERVLMRRSTAIIVLTRPVCEYLQIACGLDRNKLHVIPCCTDLTKFSAPTVPAEKNRPLKVVYSGSTFGRYDIRGMLEFFHLLLLRRPGSHMTVLASNDPGAVRSMAEELRLPAAAVTVLSVPSDQVPSHLAGKDLGLIFLRGALALLAASPTKTAEYLASGMAVIAEERLGGLKEILVDHGVGCLIDSGRREHWPRAVEEAMRLCDEPDIHVKSVRAARIFYDLAQGVDLYAKAYESCIEKPG